MSQSAMLSLIHHVEARGGDGVDPPGCVDLLSFLSVVTDPRKRRGVRHGMASSLTVAAAAVVAGARSFVAIGGGGYQVRLAGGAYVPVTPGLFDEVTGTVEVDGNLTAGQLVEVPAT